jgi:hypothetical protein
MPPPAAVPSETVTLLPLIVDRSMCQIDPPWSEMPPPSEPTSIAGPIAWLPLMVLSTIRMSTIAARREATPSVNDVGCDHDVVDDAAARIHSAPDESCRSRTPSAASCC